MTPEREAVASICATCGTQFGPHQNPPPRCPVCEDERQYVGWSGQRWTSMAELARGHRIELGSEDGVTTLRLQPSFAIDQRAFLIPHGRQNLMWECLSLVTADAVAAIKARGGVGAIAISHPHFYASMVEWSDALGGVPVYLHEADRDWVQRASPQLRFWRGERLALSDELALVHLPGHFAGSTGLWWKEGPHGGGALFPGDALQVVMDRRHVTFMYSYPNAIPLAPATVRGLRSSLAALGFADVFGFSHGRQIIGRGREAVDASFERYLNAVAERTEEQAA
jgi:glyoxylase-like metal-dependent hydrolase (beta-lactamase superfamily II)